ncbi:MAG: zinc ABC transporter substrate-binding protein [Candidatus Nitrotoga sp.]
MKKILFVVLLFASTCSHATLNIFACEPEWAALAKELAADKANIYSATTALQDPHYIEARPGLIARARGADLVVCTGAQLEIGWLPLVLQASGNSKIQPGNNRYFEAALYVTMLEIPVRLDRADGDTHASGNPHIQTDARNFLPIADALSKRLIQLDPANTVFYRNRLQSFTQAWQAALLRWEKQAAPLIDASIIVHHNAFPYLNNWLKLKQIATLEPKPGMEPGAAHLAQVLAQLQQTPARMVLRAAYQNPKSSEWIAERTNITAVMLPHTVGGTSSATDLFSLFDDTIQRLLAGLK